MGAEEKNVCQLVFRKEKFMQSLLNKYTLLTTMKLTAFLLLLGSCAALAATEEQINTNFNVAPGGTLVVNVDFGSITVSTNAASGVTIDVWRKVTRKSEAAEQEFLQNYPVHFTQDGATVTVRAEHGETIWRSWWSWNDRNRNEAKYTIRVPAQFNVQLKTAGGGISVSDLAGDTKAGTSGGGLNFTRLHGPLDGCTSGGGIQVADCVGALKIHTSGGGITVTGGSGTLDGHTSGGPVTVKNFQGNTHVGTSGGGINIENVAGEIEGQTSGGGINAVLPSPLLHAVDLSTSGGGVTVRVPANAAFELDAATSGGGVNSELPVTVVGEVGRGHLKGAVNGGGQTIRLRTSGGGIQVKKN
jgi:hypothetical protein